MARPTGQEAPAIEGVIHYTHGCAEKGTGFAMGGYTGEHQGLSRSEGWRGRVLARTFMWFPKEGVGEAR